MKNNNKNIIDSFKNEYYFLSNFYEIPVTYKGITYRNNEAAFQAMKVSVDKKEIINFILKNNIVIDYNSKFDVDNKYSIIENTILNLKRSEFAKLPPNEAKKLGRKVKLRSDWEEVKDQIMYEICYQKFNFENNMDITMKLMKTKNIELIEGNTWNDTYWGVCRGNGKNKLGKILMKIRKEKQNEYFQNNIIVYK